MRNKVYSESSHGAVDQAARLTLARLLQRGLHLFPIFLGFGEDFAFAKGKMLVVSHHKTAADYDPFNVAAFQRVGQLRINVVHRNSVWLVKIDQEDISFLARFERTD